MTEARSPKSFAGVLDAQVSPHEAPTPDVLGPLLADARPDVVPQVLEARRLVGALIAREAARSASVIDKAELRRALESVRRAKAGCEAHEAENEVHRHLASATGNAVFRLLVNSFIGAFEPFRDRLHASFRDPVRLAEELEGIVIAVEGGSPAAAEIAAAAYLEASGNRLANAMETNR